MKQSSTLFLKLVIAILSAVVLGICIFVLPMGIITDKTGLYIPVILGLYVTAIPFFIALFQSFRLLNLIDGNTAFCDKSVAAFKNINRCAITIALLFVGGLPYIAYVAENDDAPGVIAVAVVIIFASIVIATFAGVLQKLIQNAVDLKAENDLTV